jgi:hypothetical protein
MDFVLKQSENFCLVYQLLAHGRWFSPGTPSSSTTKTERHDIAEHNLDKNVMLVVPFTFDDSLTSNLCYLCFFLS